MKVQKTKIKLGLCVCFFFFFMIANQWVNSNPVQSKNTNSIKHYYRYLYLTQNACKKHINKLFYHFLFWKECGKKYKFHFLNKNPWGCKLLPAIIHEVMLKIFYTKFEEYAASYFPAARTSQMCWILTQNPNSCFNSKVIWKEICTNFWFFFLIDIPSPLFPI